MQGPFCQSCGMPIASPDLFGTEEGGETSQEYCTYCYQGGGFTAPDITLPQMIDICVPHMKNSGMEEKQARAMLNQFLPNLKRWRSAQMEYCVVEQKEIQLIGLSRRTSNADEMSGNGKIVKLAEDFYTNWLPRLPDEGNNVFAVYTEYESDENGGYTYFIGVKMNEGQPVLDGLSQLTLSPSRYAVLTTAVGVLPNVVIGKWMEIWQDRAFSTKRAFSADFEVYDERCTNRSNAQVDLYISLRE